MCCRHWVVPLGLTPLLLHEVRIITKVPSAYGVQSTGFHATAAKWQLQLIAQLFSAEEGSVLPASSG